jgi:short subunit dehydrogenase-like uncharacterized protein
MQDTSNDRTRLMIYGAYGYTGDLVVREAVRRGLRPILSGRDPEKLPAQARRFGLEYQVLDLVDPDAVKAALAETAVVINCAGPFFHTFRPLAMACIESGCHYLDVTGEIAVFEGLARLDETAKQSGVMLLPGIGFDVVPTDCLAAHLKTRLPDASSLILAFAGGGGFSRGTLNTLVEGLGEGGAVRKEGRITRVPMAWKTREVDFGRGPWTTVTIPWGDVSTAFYSTGIPDIEVYTAVPPAALRWLRMMRRLGWLLRRHTIQALLKFWVRLRAPGPDETTRAESKSLVWAEASNPGGRRVSARMVCPNGYALTAESSILAAEKVLAGGASAGFQTPSSVFGADYVLELSGTSREDINIDDPTLRDAATDGRIAGL